MKNYCSSNILKYLQNRACISSLATLIRKLRYQGLGIFIHIPIFFSSQTPVMNIYILNSTPSHVLTDLKEVSWSHCSSEHEFST